MHINVTVKNWGVSEVSNLTLFVNTTVINKQTINLAAGELLVLKLLWNSSGFAKGNYTASAVVDAVPGEIYTSDNTFSDGWIIVSIIGDITGPNGYPDSVCDMRDIGMVARNFCLIVPPAPANCDLTGQTAGLPDGKIDMRDIGMVARHFGEH
jgi:hypothetical protein